MRATARLALLVGAAARTQPWPIDRRRMTSQLRKTRATVSDGLMDDAEAASCTRPRADEVIAFTSAKEEDAEDIAIDMVVAACKKKGDVKVGAAYCGAGRQYEVLLFFERPETSPWEPEAPQWSTPWWKLIVALAVGVMIKEGLCNLYENATTKAAEIYDSPKFKAICGAAIAYGMYWAIMKSVEMTFRGFTYVFPLTTASLVSFNLLTGIYKTCDRAKPIMDPVLEFVPERLSMVVPTMQVDLAIQIGEAIKSCVDLWCSGLFGGGQTQTSTSRRAPREDGAAAPREDGAAAPGPPRARASAGATPETDDPAATPATPAAPDAPVLPAADLVHAVDALHEHELGDGDGAAEDTPPALSKALSKARSHRRSMDGGRASTGKGPMCPRPY